MSDAIIPPKPPGDGWVFNIWDHCWERPSGDKPAGAPEFTVITLPLKPREAPISATTVLDNAFQTWWAHSVKPSDMMFKNWIRSSWLEAIKAFCAEVNARAEDGIIRTHKLEGQHCAAIRAMLKELE